MVYVFIFIALRALRFEPRFIILSGAAAEDLSRFVSAEVADHITSADRAIQPGDGESKVATVLFTDIEGFSTISENLTPQELA